VAYEFYGWLWLRAVCGWLAGLKQRLTAA